MKNVCGFLLSTLVLACNNGAPGATAGSDAALAAYTDSLAARPHDAGLYYRRGVLQYQKKEWKAARADLQRAWQLAPTEQHALSLVTAWRAFSADSAIQFIQGALVQLPRSVALRISLARGFQQNGAIDSALETTNKTLALFPTSIDALLLKWELLKQSGKNADALQALENAYAVAPADAELAYNLAFEYAEQKNARALALADSLIEKDAAGKSAQPYYFKGVYYANTAQPALALQYFDKAIAHDYTFFDAYMDKGALFFEQKKYSDALAVFQLVSRITPTYADAYYWQGKTWEALKKGAEAKQAYEQAFALDKSLTAARDAAKRL